MGKFAIVTASMGHLCIIFHGRFPSEKAASLFAAKSAEAFASKGFEVTLLVPKRKNQLTDNPFAYYGIKNNFKISYVSVIDFFEIKLTNKVAFWVSMISFSFNTLRYLKSKSAKEDVIYSNEIQPLFLTSFIRRNCFYEMHDFPESKIFLFGYFLKRFKWVLVHNRWKLNKLTELFPSVDVGKFIYEPNAVDVSAFDIPISKTEARQKLGLPLDKKIFLYTGHLYGWKGVDIFAEAMDKLSDDCLAIFVGGTEKDIKIFKEKYAGKSNILVVGFRKHQEIPVWQKAADIFVLPNTAKEAISAYYTSPMKLYEYMASQRLIIASDLPSVREIVDKTSAVLVEPDNSQALAEALVKYSVSDLSVHDTFIVNAFTKVIDHTWDKRAERIIKLINSND